MPGRQELAALEAGSRFVAMLQGLPASTIAPDRIGLGRPAAASELPMIAVSIADARELPVGVGSLVRLAEIAPEQWATTTGRGVECEIRLELWAADATTVSTLTQAVVTRVESQAAALREAGFLKLSLRGFGPAQHLPLGNDPAKMMPLAYAARFESLVTPEPGGEGVIRTVHVELPGEIGESTDIP
jgi:hypothetical protein